MVSNYAKLFLNLKPFNWNTFFTIITVKQLIREQHILQANQKLARFLKNVVREKKTSDF